MLEARWRIHAWCADVPACTAQRLQAAALLKGPAGKLSLDERKAVYVEAKEDQDSRDGGLARLVFLSTWLLAQKR